jgi:hypothetical protein
MTERQHLKYIPNRDPEKLRRNAIDRADDFVNSSNVRAISILEIQHGLLILYEDVLYEDV